MSLAKSGNHTRAWVPVHQQIVTTHQIADGDYPTMRKFFYISALVLVLQVQDESFAALDRLSDFALLDNDGRFHQLSRYQHKRALVIMAYGSECDSMAQAYSQFQAVQAKFKGLEIEFLLIDPFDLGRSAISSLQLDIPILEDGGQLVSETLGIAHTGEVLVLNPRRSTLYYQGAADAGLESALDGVLAGSLTDTVRSDSLGCPINFPMADIHKESPPDYATEVVPIIQEKCAGCHKQGGVGPFAMDSHIMMMGWSPMIREVLLNKRMPPTQVDSYIGHSDDARYLSKRELQTLVHWIDAGAPAGEFQSDPLELPAEETEGWLLGEPDFIARTPEQEVPATGVLDYRYVSIDLPFEEDKWISAIQYRAGDASVLHHLMTFVTAPGEDFWGEERSQTSTSRRFIEGYSPGTENLSVFNEGTGVLIPKGHRLSMQLHYVTNGQSTTDETELGLYFSDSSELKEKRVQAVSTRFEIPANTAEFPQRASHEFEEAVVITGIRARMNYRGKRMEFLVETPAGEQSKIFSVPAYNYGWQPHYVLDEPIYLSAGSRVIVDGAFDNSVSNPTNPNPDAAVGFGMESWEEMFAGYFTYHIAEP
ncbi:MAG: hypothetical protein AB8B95_15110 [Pseudohongiellaceae bacterium]